MTDTVVWVGLSVVAAVTVAAMALASEYSKQPTVPRLFWLRLISLVALAPFAVGISWPEDPLFYAYMVAISLLICGSDGLYYSAAKTHGAGVTTRIEPLSVPMTFVAWVLMSPDQLGLFYDRPLVGFGIALCFAVAGFCAWRLRRCPVSLPVLKRLSPVVFTMAGVAILGKMAMDAGGAPFDAAVAYIVIQCVFLVVFYAGVALIAPARTGSLAPTRALLASAGLMAACSVTHIASKNIAYTYVDNPAYVIVICLAAPLVVAAFYRAMGRPDDSDVLAGFGIVISSIFLVILTRF